jgi:heme exporter protein D
LQAIEIMSIEQFFHMGGYAFYVWTSYGLALGVLVLNVLLALRRRHEVKKRVTRMMSQHARKHR